jgi:WD40 repeat protein
MTFSLNQDFLVSQAKWSTNGNYLAVTSCRNKQLRVYQVDQMTQENVWTLKDQLK